MKNTYRDSGAAGRKIYPVTPVCPVCGREKYEWGQTKGFRKDGESYCCSGCAKDTGCTCVEVLRTKQFARLQRLQH